MIRYIISACALVLLVGCESNKPKCDPIYVNVPVLTVPEPPPKIEFKLRTPQLTGDTPPGEVAKAYVSDLLILKEVTDTQDKIIESYRQIYHQTKTPQSK